MRFQSKFTISLFATAILPLALAIGLALWQGGRQTTSLTLGKVQGELNSGAEDLSGFFAARIAEVATYAEVPLLKSMDFTRVRPYLLSELERHGSTYEKFILATPKGHFYNTAGGNPAFGGLRTFDDKSPTARLKTIKKRDYWQAVVGHNSQNAAVTYVSDPMISYTTGAKQIVVAATILSADKKVLGMIGGALPWSDIEKRISQIDRGILQKLGWEAKFFLISSVGTFWYHWDTEKVVHLKVDNKGNPLVNSIGEKIAVKKNISNENLDQWSLAGERMMSGQSGHVRYFDKDLGKSQYIIFSPLRASGYAIGIVVPEEVILAPVTQLQWLFLLSFLVASLLAVVGGWFVSDRMTQPIVSLNSMAKRISQGDWKKIDVAEGDDEISELIQSLNLMIDSHQSREHSLRKSEERFSLAMAGANDGLWDWDIGNNEIYYSPRWYTMLGYQPDDLPASLDVWKGLVEPGELASVLEKLNDFIEAKAIKYEAEIPMRHKDGHYVNVLSRAFAVRENGDGRAIRLVGTHVDISEQKCHEAEVRKLNASLEVRIHERTQELERINEQLNKEIDWRSRSELALRRSEKLLEQTGRLARVGGWKLDFRTYDQHWTDETYEIYEIQKNRKINFKDAVNYFPPGARDVIQQAVDRSAETGENFDIELPFITESGKHIWLRAIGEVQQENGEGRYLIGALQDITHLKEVERLKNEFVSTVSHELRTPLTSIRGSIELVRRDVIGGVNDEGRDLLDIASRNAERLLHIINDLLDMEKIASGRMQFELEHVKLAALIEQSLAENRSYGEQFNVTFNLVERNDEVYVNADRKRLLQVMSNLLSNASKFSPPGSHVDVAVMLTPHHTIRVEVRDFGEGIPEQVRDEIFSKFYQVDGSSTRKIAGTGLGLSISKSIIDQLHGAIDFTSVLGEGTVFYFELPVEENAARQQSACSHS